MHEINTQQSEVHVAAQCICQCWPRDLYRAFLPELYEAVWVAFWSSALECSSFTALYSALTFTKFEVCVVFRLEAIAHFLAEPYMVLRLELWPQHWSVSYMYMATFKSILGCLELLVLELRAVTGQTDRQTDAMRNVFSREGCIWNGTGANWAFNYVLHTISKLRLHTYEANTLLRYNDKMHSL